MKAQVFYGPGDLRLEEVPRPEPGPGEVVLRIDAALTCGTDVKTLRRGHPVMIPRLPTIFGHEFAGTIAAVGPEVEGVRPGDRAVAANSAPCGACPACRRGTPNLCDDLLFVNGAYAEYIALPRRLVAKNLVRVPAAADPVRLAFAEPVACCLRALDAAQLAPGLPVAVLGHGPLGLLLGLLARAAGARVVLAGKAGPRLERARQLGFEACVDAGAAADPVAAIREAAGGDVRCTIEATGRPEAWEQAIALAGKGGTVIFFGGCSPGVTVPLDTRRMHYEELRLLGVFHHTPGLVRRAVSLLADGTLDPSPLITHELGLGDVPAALALMSRGEALKVLIRPRPGSEDEA
ncbi:MAG TPA: alcohol dehydrogenase catalytic domain-containing protein [Methylomirabilota bacterium]|nr:alcohol dehydrogenase catalytic domain-containing protein [Methylomirabilota bacterium]